MTQLTRNPAFGERIQIDLPIGTSSGYYYTMFISWNPATGWNYSDWTTYSYWIPVSGYGNSDAHPPCTTIPSRGGPNLSHLNWVASSQQIDKVVIEFRVLSAYDAYTGIPTPTWTFVTNVDRWYVDGWHWFPSQAPEYARFAYRLKTVGPSQQSIWSNWVLVEPWDPTNP